jgi:hypothetical protein
MNFGQALDKLKEGARVARRGWNGKDMWIGLMAGTTINAEQVNERTRKHVPEGELRVAGYIAMWTAQGTWAPGWLASQADMLADDWFELPPA